ncbi:MAG: hypothetical protein H6960_01545 [Chromatiaceae bacterium]|nr:hypothetical protein [Chromatiaceae bacterium]
MTGTVVTVLPVLRDVRDRAHQTRRGGPWVMAARLDSRRDEAAGAVSKVTGGSGNTDKGALITYSGGARG